MILSVVCQAQPLTGGFFVTIDSPSLNPMKQKELCQEQPVAAIITMPGSGNNQQQYPPSESPGQEAQETTARPTVSFNSFLYSDSAEGNGGPQQSLHSLDLNCFVSPCHGVCQFRTSSDSSGSTEWSMNSAENSTGHTGATPEQSSCPYLDNGRGPECAGHVTDVDVQLMDDIAQPTVPMDTDASPESDPCPICLVHFHDRDEALVVVRSQCCGHRFDLDCISRCFVDQPIGSRRCAMCRQDPMPMLNEKTGESHPDTFFPDEALYLACFEGDLDQLENLLAEGVNINAVMDDNFTVLMLASCLGHRDIVERLIQAGADLNARTKNGNTALLLTARENIADCLKILIEANANLNARDKDGATSLFIAAWENNTDCVKILIKAKADLNLPRPDGATPLFIAAQRGHTDIVKLLIEAGADLNVQTKDGATPLFITAAKGNTDSVKALIEAKADVNTRTKNGVTSLFIAAQEGHADIVKRLIQAGADLNARTKNGATALLIATLKGHTDCLKILIEARADINVTLSDGATPLFIAALMGNTDCAQLLIDAGANLNTLRTWDGATPLSIATEMGNTDCVIALTGAERR
ncbi:ankyrin repeat domain-containing protein [Endozoicomonas sp. ISHI1]|uniref:ankyrin repeat domain-containing protein n=2 Tax=Endozoicomonas TaxID=305899 RepID=UPI0021494A56|nr:ankyrin repeat domain-containing protein [Endozoicomonas sp. ISHI1]